jgi:hypothetical protein
MDFAELFATVPLGAIVAFSDGTPQPPKHHKKKLSAWENKNAKGRLIGKRASKGLNAYDRDTVTLETGVYGSGETIVLRVRRTFQAVENTALTLSTFEVLETLAPGSFAIVSDSVHTGRELHAVRSTRAAIEAEKVRGFNVDSYWIAEIGANGVIIEREEVAA